MKKKFVKLMATLFTCATFALGFAACEDAQSGSSSNAGDSASTEQSTPDSSSPEDSSSGDSAHEHEYTAVVTAPTCTEQGFTTHTCTCGDSYIADYVNALDHEFINYVSDGNAKCEVNGTETATCNRDGCNEKDTRTEENSALDHEFINYVSDNNAKCGVDGTETATCNRDGCNEKDTRTEENSALEHEFIHYVSDNNAKCGVDGTETATCNRDGCNEKDTRTEENSALDHEFIDYVSDGNAKCGVNGTETATCNRDGCNETDTREDEDSALDHEFITYVSDGNAKCGVDGTETATCNRDGCNETDTRTEEDSALDHEFTNYVSDNNATYGADGTKTATCNRDGCNEKDTITDEGTKLQSSISFKTLSVNGTKVYGKVSNATTEFSFIDEVTVKGNATYIVDNDKDCNTPIKSKTVDLEVGDNTFYVLEMIGNDVKLYTVTVRRRPMYDVIFNVNGGTSVQTQVIEEDHLATEPETTKTGYTFKAWDYDFSKPITKTTTVMASWTANTNTAYKVEYYLQNLENDNYTLTQTVNKTGTTDTTANADIKEFAHFTYNAYNSQTQGNVHDDGSQVLKVYYTRNTYTLSKNNSFGTITNQGTYKYGKAMTTTATPYLGYNFIGWYNENTLLSTDTTYTFALEKNVTAKFEMKEEMSNFNFTSTATACQITGVKDKTVAKMVVPDFVTSIDGGAFYGCSSLTEITLPFVGANKSATSASSSTLFGYIFGSSSYTGGAATTQDWAPSRYTTYYIPTSLKKVTVTGGNLLYGAFYWCRSLTSVVIGDSVTSIGDDAFAYCDSLTSVVIGDVVTSIGDYAFRYCDSLTIYCEVASQPSGWVSSWNYSNRPVVWDCNNNDVADDGYIYVVIDNLRYGIKDGVATVVRQARNIQTATIPASITYKGTAYSVTSIGKYAFFNCRSLTSVVIGDSVTSIGWDAFEDCSSLTSVVIPDSVTSIGNYAFKYCSSLTSIVIPNGVTSIANYAFSGCSSLTIYCEAVSKPSGWNSSWSYSNRPVVWDCKNNDVADDGYIYVMIDNLRYCIKDGVATVVEQASNIQTATIPAGITYKGTAYRITSIGDDAFAYCRSLTSVVIPDSVTSIGEEAFYYCSSLTSIEIPDSVTSIGDTAFYNCDSLTRVVIPDSVTSIGEEAFSSCYSLTRVVIGDSVTSIGEEAFSSCNSLTSVYYKGTASDWAKISIGSSNGYLTNAKRYYYSKSKPALNSSGTAYDGNYYWRYVDGMVTPWFT